MTARMNECGHPERKHCARGMCRACYQRHWAQDPEVRARNNAYQASYKKGRRQADPEYREKVYARERLRRSKPEVRAQLSECTRRYRADPEVRERINVQSAQRAHEAYADPVRREKLRAGVAKYQASRRGDPEYRRRKSECAKRYRDRLKRTCE